MDLGSSTKIINYYLTTINQPLLTINQYRSFKPLQLLISHSLGLTHPAVASVQSISAEDHCRSCKRAKAWALSARGEARCARVTSCCARELR